jgi:hypothetical protein
VSQNSTGGAVDVERRAALNGVKLAALVAQRWGPADRQLGAFGTTATLIGAGADRGADVVPPAGSPPGVDRAVTVPAHASTERDGWVLSDRDVDRVLGPALTWADRQDVDALHLVADADPATVGALARQAALFTPAPSVWAIDATTLVAAAAAPVPTSADAPAPSQLVDLLVDAGLEIVVEGAMVRGEINGLEVARIVAGHTTAGEPIDEPQLEVGVGKVDRELTAMVHSGLPAVAQLGRVVEIVRQHRRPGAPRHPLNQLVPDRWLRAVLCRAPGLVGLTSLRPAEGARPRPNLSDRDVAMAVGKGEDGDRVVVGCSVGIALDLVPTAADARLAIDTAAGSPPSRLVLAVPERDEHSTVHRLAARLRAPADVVPISGDWRAAD